MELWSGGAGRVARCEYRTVEGVLEYLSDGVVNRVAEIERFMEYWSSGVVNLE